jgi:hypothetical protein
MLWSIKNKAELYYCLLLCIYLVRIYYGDPPTAMNAVLAIIDDGGQVIVVIDREAVEINYFLLYY